MSQWVLPLIIGLLSWGFVAVSAIVITFILPESYASSVRLRVAPTPTSNNDPQKPLSAPSSASAFINTECEVIRSEVILAKVISDLDLNAEWGRKYAGGERLRTPETMAVLKNRMEVRPVVGANVIEVRVFSERPEEASVIANDIARSYRAHALEAASQPGGTMVEIIDRAVPGIRPVRPNKPLNIALGLVAGGVLGLAAAGITFGLGHLFRRLSRR